jgi:hypothetical protein
VVTTKIEPAFLPMQLSVEELGELIFLHGATLPALDVWPWDRRHATLLVLSGNGRVDDAMVRQRLRCNFQHDDRVEVT